MTILSTETRTFQMRPTSTPSAEGSVSGVVKVTTAVPILEDATSPLTENSIPPTSLLSKFLESYQEMDSYR